MMGRRIAGWGLAGLLLAGCGVRAVTPPPLPTVAPFEAAATALVLTQNAPPPGFATVAFPRIDANLNLLTGWRAEMQLRFDGVYARTTRPAVAVTRAHVEFNQVASARRVLTAIDNDITSASDPVQFEAVRLGPDVFLLRDGVCLSNAGEDAAIAADFSAAQLIGGVQQARAAGVKAIINGEEVWRYEFTAADVVLANVTLAEGGQIRSVIGELWVAPARNAVIRYYATLELENARVLDAALPLSGTLRLSYDVLDIGVVPNLSVPFGC